MRSEKRQSLSRQSNSPVVLAEGFYQSTPRVDADIGPLTLFHPPAANYLSTLPSEPALQGLPVHQNLPGNLQSHVSDFFQQISMATSPEDVMESESLPFASRRRRYPVTGPAEHQHTPHLPKLARITKLQARNKTPYHTKVMAEGERRRRRRSRESETTSTGTTDATAAEEEVARQTPLAGKLSKLELDGGKALYENMDISPQVQQKYAPILTIEYLFVNSP